MATVDLTLAECCDRWAISRNAVKSRAAALGVELRRESSTRTVWPGEDVPLGDRLHEHLKRGGTLASFPESLPSPTGSSDPSVPPPAATSDRGGKLSVPPAGAITAEGIAAMVLAAREALPPSPPDPLAVPRALAAAADERLPLTSEELGSLIGWSAEQIEQSQDGKARRKFTLRGFRLEQRGSRGGKAWYVSRLAERPAGEAAPTDAVGSLAAPTGSSDGKRVGFHLGEVIEARVEVMAGPRLFPVPRW